MISACNNYSATCYNTFLKAYHLFLLCLSFHMAPKLLIVHLEFCIYICQSMRCCLFKMVQQLMLAGYLDDLTGCLFPF